MRRHILFLTVLFAIPLSGAEPVGDFAPLEVGNEWVYQYSAHFRPMVRRSVSDRAMVITLLKPRKEKSACLIFRAGLLWQQLIALSEPPNGFLRD